jgi:hypothetical protein
LKGISEDDREHNEKLIMEVMDLEEFKDVMAVNLSGGN